MDNQVKINEKTQQELQGLARPMFDLQNRIEMIGRTIINALGLEGNWTFDENFTTMRRIDEPEKEETPDEPKEEEPAEIDV